MRRPAYGRVARRRDCNGPMPRGLRAVNRGLRARQARAGRSEWAARNQVDLHARATGETRDADARPGRSPSLRKIAGVHGIHSCVVVVEVAEEYAYRHDGIETETASRNTVVRFCMT